MYNKSNQHLLTPRKNRASKKDLKVKNNLISLNLTKLILKTLILGKKFLLREKVGPLITHEDFIDSQRLLYKEYLKKSLCSENKAGLYFNIFTFLSTTTTLISKHLDKLTATVTIIGDGELGLPADLLYKDELDEMRENGNVLIEVGALALDNNRFKKNAHSLKSIKKFSTMATLFAGLLNYVYQFTNATHLVIMVNPKHVEIYKFIGFTQFAEIRHYPLVNKPAVPMIMEFEYFLSSANFNQFAFFVLRNMVLLKKEVKYQHTANSISQLVLNRPEFFSELSPNEENVLLRNFPELISIFETIRISKRNQVNLACYQDLPA